MPRMSSFSEEFNSKSKVADVELQNLYLGNSSEADWVYTGWIDYYDESLLVQMPNQSTGTVLSSTKYLWYGKVGATLKTSRTRGVVTAFILFSDVQDEIDYEFVGYDLVNPQSNYYAQGILNYSNSENSTVNNTYEYYHLYEMDWQEDKIDWYVDGEKVRTLEKEATWNDTTKRYDYPQTPSRIQVSLWPGGDGSNGVGTIEWAGGLVDWDSEDIQQYGYFYAQVKNIYVDTYDLPDHISLQGNSSNGDDYHAFLYNNTKGDDTDIYLTNKKTWLGSDDATGFDPQNEDEDEDTHLETTITKTSGSSTITSISTASTTQKTANVPAQNTAAANQDTTSTTAKGATTTNTYDPSAGVGGFVQDSKASSTASGSSGSSPSSSGSAGKLNDVIIGIFAAFALGIISFLV